MNMAMVNRKLNTGGTKALHTLSSLTLLPTLPTILNYFHLPVPTTHPSSHITSHPHLSTYKTQQLQTPSPTSPTATMRTLSLAGPIISLLGSTRKQTKKVMKGCKTVRKRVEKKGDVH